ncbi:ACT domain-containing protein [Dactylosporangium aurantiacum]|uniref:ACT domain-containing protein n=1 Tax=Dactylosporangium aurantiacum TaxID=35754 RepID=A0A9Q9MMQ3_9ACTN|nr:ACT domain-containing protein [Dactylosporangium aurantiacum]MDG6100997.1 ACT domain-containing protein [Dactylosporangium aurantiacum]UWZ54957.1 ACT domain-containing protein [Dactylosporangium aurantiacum]
MNEYAVTVIGHDRPGIIADVAEVLAGLGLNLTDSTMTRLRGHFAMTLVCAGAVAAAEIESALAPLTAGRTLLVTVREVGEDLVDAPSGEHYVLTVHGADRLGIVAALSRTVAAAGGNITDLTTRLAGNLYVVVAEVDAPGDMADLAAAIDRTAAELGVEATLRAGEADLM